MFWVSILWRLFKNRSRFATSSAHCFCLVIPYMAKISPWVSHMDSSKGGDRSLIYSCCELSSFQLHVMFKMEIKTSSWTVRLLRETLLLGKIPWAMREQDVLMLDALIWMRTTLQITFIIFSISKQITMKHKLVKMSSVVK